MAIPHLAVRRHYARVATLRLMQSREIALERQLAATIAHVGRQAAGHYWAARDAAAPLPIEQRISRVLLPSLRETARAFGSLVVEKSTAMGLERKAFEDLDAATQAYINEYTATRVVQISDAMRAQIAEVVRQGLAEGWGTEAIAAAIEDLFAGEMAMARARRIARTETHTAAMVGQFEAARNSPLQWRKTWLATEDSRTRESHREANGQERDLEEPFSVGDAELMFPGDPEGPPGEVINCFPAGTRVSGAITGATRHWYEGDLVEITTARGHKLAGTPNHPVLTPDGWVALGALKEGGDVVCCGSIGRSEHVPPAALPSAQDIDDIEPCIEQVFDALANRWLGVRVSHLAVDFHGDQPAHDVDVVRAEGVLHVGVNAARLEHLGKLALAAPDLASGGLLRDRALSHLFGRALHAAHRVVRSACEAFALVGRRVGHALEHGLAPVARAYAGVGETEAYCAALDVQRHGDCLDGLASIKAVHHVGSYCIAPLSTRQTAGVALGPQNARLPKMEVNAGTKALLKLSRGASRLIETDRIVNVQSRRFVGHVYNLESAHGLYEANGIVSHNCRCTMTLDPIPL